MKCHQVGIVRSESDIFKYPKQPMGQKFFSVYVMLLVSKMLLLLKNGHREKNRAESTILILVQMTQCFEDVFLLQLNSLFGMLLRQLVHPAAHPSNSRKRPLRFQSLGS